jgi:GNAT superfamily N-acetyltransferase
MSQHDGLDHRSALRLERLSLDETTAEILVQLEELYARAYANSHMHADLLDDVRSRPEVFQLFMVRAGRRVVGARVIESKRHPFVDYMGFPPIHGKRFAVLPELRGEGIGHRIVQASTEYTFHELGMQAIFGESNEVGALAMHGREGALFLLDSIAKLLPRNSPTQATVLFAELIANRRLREFRFPTGDGVQFAYCRDDETSRQFRARGYRTSSEFA